uniref:Non-specific serine/threonine protein kinase n=1 Tax=Rhabditophanes sp. KR3021 TaxID=114890 RepID=A0AC35TYW1_9BILA
MFKYFLKKRSSKLSKEEKAAVPKFQIGPYVLTKTIGEGSYGKVKLGINSGTNHKVAIKILNRQKMKELDVVHRVKLEITNVQSLNHPHIVKLFQAICTPSDLFLFMEFVPNGELLKYIQVKGNLEIKEIRRFFQQLVSAVDYCHKNDIIHRDLKSENILLDIHINVKLADFGFSTKTRDGDFLKTNCGSINYVAPEILCGTHYSGPQADIWSTGVSLQIYFLFILLFYSNYDWFKKDLPPYLFPLISEHESSIVDIDIVKEVCERYGVKEEEVTSALLSNNPHNYLSIAYNLNVKARDELFEQKNAKYTYDPKTGLTKVAPPESYSKQVASSYKTCQEYMNAPPLTPNTNINGPRIYKLGVEVASTPYVIMEIAFTQMKKLDYEWKILSEYHYVFRTKENPSPVVGVQLFCIDETVTFVDRRYIFDFKKIVSENDSGISSLTSSHNGSWSNQEQFKLLVSSFPQIAFNEAEQCPLTPPLTQNLVRNVKKPEMMLFFYMCDEFIQALTPRYIY